jgi:hypothetical protein
MHVNLGGTDSLRTIFWRITTRNNDHEQFDVGRRAQVGSKQCLESLLPTLNPHPSTRSILKGTVFSVHTMDSLERLQGLHADLLAFSETRLANIDRLWQELEGSVQDFRTLLDRPSPSAADREAYNNGMCSRECLMGRPGADWFRRRQNHRGRSAVWNQRGIQTY